MILTGRVPGQFPTACACTIAGAAKNAAPAKNPLRFIPASFFLLQEALPGRLDLIGALRKRLVVHKPDGRSPPRSDTKSFEADWLSIGLIGPSAGEAMPRFCGASGHNAVEAFPLILQFCVFCRGH